MHQSFFLQFYLGGATLEVSRRNLLKATIAGAGLSLAGCGYDVQSVQSAVNDFKLDDANEYTSICTFCACGCGMVGYVKEGKMINLEGDSDHIVNEGGLCSKGASMSVIPNSEGRVLTPKYRAPKSNKWEEISWDEALDKIASKIKQVRDDNWIASEEENGKTYADNIMHLKEDNIIAVKGIFTPNHEDNTGSLTTRKIMTLGQALEENTASLKITIDTEKSTPDRVFQIKTLLSRFKGNLPVQVVFILPNKYRVLMGVSEDYGVCPEIEFLELLKQVPGVIDIEFIPAGDSTYSVTEENYTIDTWSIA